MNFDDLQKSWQSQDAGTRISIDADLLLKEVRRNQQQFRATILMRDLREVSVAFILVGVFIFLGVRLRDWTDYLVALACFWVGGYMVIDRRLQKKKTPELHDSLKGCVTTSLAEVSHQIWLLKNILWWYLLPIAIPVLFSVFWAQYRAGGLDLAKVASLTGVWAVIVLVYWFVYWLNQYAVRKTLKPRMQELESLLGSLEA